MRILHSLRRLNSCLTLLVVCFWLTSQARAQFTETSDDLLSGPGHAFIPPAALEPDFVSVESQFQMENLLDRIEKLEKADSSRTKKDAEKKASDSKKPTVKFSQETQLDAYTFSQDNASKAAYGDIDNGTAFRRARIAMMGDYGPSEYRIEVDFAQPGRPSFLDVYGGFHDIPYIGRIRVGHYFEPFLLDRLTSNRYQIFMERDLLDQAFAPSRNSGASIDNTYLKERGTYSLGVFRKDNDQYGDDVGDTFEECFDGRITYLPYYDEASDGKYMLHLGFAYSVRGTNNNQVRFRAQPEARLGAATPNVPYFVDTGTIAASSYQLIGFESAWVHGPLSLQAEYVLTPVATRTGGMAYMQGFYTFASFFLTGEHRTYDRGAGVFSRIKPNRDVFRYVGRPEDKCVGLGPGAWEIATRVSFLDFNDGIVHGGQLTDLTVGLNWYLTPYTRITSNYIHAFGQSATGIRSNTDIFGTRFQYDF